MFYDNRPWCRLSPGHSSVRKVTMVWCPEDWLDRARLISMKKKRKLQSCGTAISSMADGYVMKASATPPSTTLKIVQTELQ